MSSRSSAVLAAFGAVLLLTLGSLALVGAAQGRFGSRSVLTLVNCGPRNPTGAVDENHGNSPWSIIEIPHPVRAAVGH